MYSYELYGTYRGAFDTLVNRVQLSSPNEPWGASMTPFQPISLLPDSPAEQESRYPKVRFWRRSQWKVHNEKLKGVTDPTTNGDVVRGKTAVSQGENISTLYIEDEHGNPVDGHRLTDIRKVARRIWNKFADVGQAPPTWGKANMNFTNEYRREMGRHFPELRLCENDWKSELLAIENYPSWYNNHCRPKVKKEEGSSTRPDKKKRTPNHNTGEDDQAAKKQRVDLTPEVAGEVPIRGASSSMGSSEAPSVNEKAPCHGVTNLDLEVLAEPRQPIFKVCNVVMPVSCEGS